MQMNNNLQRIVVCVFLVGVLSPCWCENPFSHHDAVCFAQTESIGSYIYRVDPPQIPAEDLSGEIGQRLLKLLSIQVERDLEWLEQFKAEHHMKGDSITVPNSGAHLLLALSVRAYGFATLSKFGQLKVTMGGSMPQELVGRSKAIVRAMIESHLTGGGATGDGKAWGNMWQSARVTGVLGMAAWLIWDELDELTRLGIARLIGFEADRFNDLPAWGNIHNDTKAEENAWHSMAMALAYCILKNHPHRNIWGERAKQYMLSSFATAADVAGDKIIDGKPIKEWIKRPNAHPDYTVENHNQVHPDYMSSYYLSICNAIAYRLAGEPLPQSTVYNADKVYEVLTFLSLPDGNHFYPQGTDWAARRLDSPLHATIVNPFIATPLGITYELRILDNMEAIAGNETKLPLDGWIPGIDKGQYGSFGTTWALFFNYLCSRFYGLKGQPLPDEQLEEKLVGVRVFEPARMAVHRTAKSISSFSWFPQKIMALTIPLDRDVLCYPLPNSYVGVVRQKGREPYNTVRWHRVQKWDNAFSVLGKIDWCWDKVRQNLSFISMPDGTSVYIEQRIALQDIELDISRSGMVSIYDDARWPHQKKSRQFFGPTGVLEPADRTFKGNWVNVDNRLGYAVLGRNSFRMLEVTPALERGRAHYHTVEIMFNYLPLGPAGQPAGQKYRATKQISRYALVTSPHQNKEQTAVLAEALNKRGWLADRDGLMALEIGSYVVFANFSAHQEHFIHHGRSITAPSLSAGWLEW
ncbi:MAG: hypothetical protein ACYTF1_12845 [Planctomycetota bacterium]|jgi:hypothetical protein